MMIGNDIWTHILRANDTIYNVVYLSLFFSKNLSGSIIPLKEKSIIFLKKIENLNCAPHW